MNKAVVLVFALSLVLSQKSLSSIKYEPKALAGSTISCSIRDVLETSLFFNPKAGLSEKDIQGYSRKILESPNKGSFQYRKELFRVRLVSITENQYGEQSVVYASEGVDDVLNLLEIKAMKAKITRNVDSSGKPLHPSFIDTGDCRAFSIKY